MLTTRSRVINCWLTIAEQLIHYLKWPTEVNIGTSLLQKRAIEKIEKLVPHLKGGELKWGKRGSGRHCLLIQLSFNRKIDT